MAPPSPELERAKRAYSAGDYLTAASLFKSLLRERPTSIEVLSHLGVAECHMGKVDSGRRRLRKAQKIAPNHPEIARRIAVAYRMQGRLEEAMEEIDKALALRPGDVSFLGTKADCLFLQGRFDEALEMLAPAADRLDVASLDVYARLCQRLGREGEAIDLVRASLEGISNPVDRSGLLFRLGHLLDSAGEYEEAWRAFEEANGLLQWRFDPDAFDGLMERTVEGWTREAVAGAPRARASIDLPVLIVGMYRSGGSLVEQIIDTHPRAAGAGELPDLWNACEDLLGRGGSRGVVEAPIVTDPGDLTQSRLERGARSYLATLRKVGGKAERVTDKHPFNFAFLGAASLMLPKARVVHTLRDPVDTCLSCYFNRFAGAVPYFCHLEHLGRFYRGYRRLMGHWAETLELLWLDLRYERLLADQEAETRKLVEFLGLEWDEACLRFHENPRVTMTASNEQVRRPIFTSSVKRWKRYEQHLGPLIEALGPLADEG